MPELLGLQRVVNIGISRGEQLAPVGIPRASNAALLTERCHLITSTTIPIAPSPRNVIVVSRYCLLSGEPIHSRPDTLPKARLKRIQPNRFQPEWMRVVIFRSTVPAGDYFAGDLYGPYDRSSQFWSKSL